MFQMSDRSSQAIYYNFRLGMDMWMSMFVGIFLFIMKHGMTVNDPVPMVMIIDIFVVHFLLPF